MKWMGRLLSRLGIVSEFWNFMRVRKKWWLVPIVTLLLLLDCLDAGFGARTIHLHSLLMKRFLSGLYRGWMAFAHVLGTVQTLLSLSVIYFAVVGFVAPLMRLFSGDPLNLRGEAPGSLWSTRANTNRTLQEARHPF